MLLHLQADVNVTFDPVAPAAALTNADVAGGQQDLAACNATRQCVHVH
jgi:hypothetical protein